MHQVNIEKLIYGGDGLGRLESGQVAMVPYTVPGDRLSIQVTKQAKNLIRGTLGDLLSASEYRIQPPCSVFGRCGGCHWQTMAPETQRYWKREIVRETLQKMAKIPNPQVLEVIGESAWHYRNKVEWHVKSGGEQNHLGYMAPQSNTLIPFELCHIIPPVMNELYHWLQSNFPPIPHVEKIQVKMNSNGDLLLTLYGPTTLALPEDWLANLKHAFPSLQGVLVENQVVYGQPYLEETLRDHRYRISGESFFQVNNSVTEQLLDFLKAQIPENTATLLDLYAGVGTFAIALHQQAERVLAIENHPAAIADAEFNVSENQALNITIHQATLPEGLQELAESYDVTILDPPRQGCDPEVLKWVAENTQTKILYISCDPTTLARDLKTLVEANWHLTLVQPCDMFPQTYHIESVAVLERS